MFAPFLPPSNLGYCTQPALHVDTLVFVSQGDLWRVDAKGRLAHALTGHTVPASYPAISPDGRTVAFAGTYEGAPEAYTMSLDGGMPTRLTYGGYMYVAGWTPDGKVMAATLAHGLPDKQLTTIDPATRRQSPMPLSQASDGCTDAGGRTLFFTRLPFQGSQTKRYSGGFVQRIWKYTHGAPETVELTKGYAGTSRAPMVWKGRVYFLSDRDGTMNLWSMDENGVGAAEPVTKGAKVLAMRGKPSGIETRQIEVPVTAGDYRSLDTNGERLFVVDAPAGGGAPSLMAIDVKDREIGPKPLLPGAGSYALSRDGKKIVAQVGGRLLTLAAAGGPGPSTSPAGPSPSTRARSGGRCSTRRGGWSATTSGTRR